MPDDYFTPKRFAGKTVIVTGCARGMGRGACLRLAREGANVVGVDWIEDLGRETIEMLTAEGHNARFIHGDVGTEETCDRMVREAHNPGMGKAKLSSIPAIERMVLVKYDCLRRTPHDRSHEARVRDKVLLVLAADAGTGGAE